MATLDKKRQLPSGSQPGIAIDGFGGRTVDPTENVKALNEASVKRLDDLAELREKHQEKIADIRDKHYKELDEKESSRLDSIRQVDVQNQALAAKAALDAIQALAATTTVNADNIRNALTATTASNAKATTDLAASIAASTAATAEGLSIRIAALEKSNAEGVGKGRVADPQLDALMAKVDSLALTRSSDTGSSQRGTAIWGFVVGGIGALVGIVLLILRFTNQ